MITKRKLLILSARVILSLTLACCFGVMTNQAIDYSKAQYFLVKDWLLDKVTIREVAKDCSTQSINTVTLADLIQSKAREHSIDYRLLISLIQTESNFNPDAVSEAGALGLMQLMPAWKNSKLCPHLKYNADFFNPEANLECGIKVLKYEIQQQGTLKKALQRYNGSENCMRSAECSARTEKYASNIINLTLSRLVKEG